MTRLDVLDAKIAALQAERRERNPLTDRETQVLQLVAQGHSNKAVAAEVGITEPTVKYHLGGAMRKLGVETRINAVLEGWRRGLLPPPEIGDAA